ncbi:MAG: acetyl-CoA carboxylase biotin carboxyl carrier protein, partial [Notoacmeibacter sp.]|nr:acetyl-CoA carboxylase biotin carboxyl carrier protein [Notoacmeibacter sp.]
MASKSSGIDQQLIRDLAEILNDTNLSEIEIEQDDLRVRVSRQIAAAPLQSVQTYQAPPAA